MKLLKSVFFIFIIFIIVIWFGFEYTLNIPVVTQYDLHYLLTPGATTRDIANDLSKSRVISHPLIFRLMARIRGVDQTLQAGEYRFPIGSSIATILHCLVTGKVIDYDFTIVNGWNYSQVISLLDKTPNIQHTLIGLTSNEIAVKLNIAQSTPEGWLFPETYRYTRGTTDLSILQQAHQLMLTKLNDAWQNRAKNLWYKTPYQGLIVASMIEKESDQALEKPVIAAIILKRLLKWMPLQIDSTVIYGLGKDFTGKLTINDLKHKTAYNTYTKYGLPPSPISLPGEDSIIAAMHPVNTDAWYFVSKGDGSHVFSATLAGQDKQVAKYQLKSRSNTIKRKIK